MPVIPREQALQRLARHERNGMVKVVTGLRRCGKTFLLFEIFRSHLLGRDVPPDHVIGVRLDLEDDAELRDPHRLYEHVLGEVKDDAPYYVLIDEIQNAISPDEFRDLAYSSPRIYAVLNSFLARPNLDVYVTGSNSRFLSSDVLTEFRGRGTQVPLRPLTFSEYVEARSVAIEGVASSPAGGDASVAPEPSLADYLAYGGMPLSVLEPNVQERREYLRSLLSNTYRKDIIERYRITKIAEMDALITYLASTVGSITSGRNVARDLKSRMGSELSVGTALGYLKHLSESFLIDAVPQRALRGRALLEPRFKHYFEDVGLRNAQLAFSSPDRGHVFENVVYNELVARGFEVGVGRVIIREGKASVRRELECDFVAEDAANGRRYIQVAWTLEGDGVEEREKRPLKAIRDAHPKLLVVGDLRGTYRDDDGIVTIGAEDFLLAPDGSWL